MAKFYGSIQGNRGAATRCGHSRIKTSVQSYDGSVIVEMNYNDNELMVCVSAASISTSYGSPIFYGTFEEFISKLKA
jgi:hypothetical protein